MSRTGTVAAVDLGAGSGRVVLGRVGPGELEATVVHRFPNERLELATGLHWDLPALYDGMLEGLRRAGDVVSVGIDSWAVDYGLVGSDGELLGLPFHYRDARTDGVVERVHAQGPGLFATNGLQVLPLNTVYQLAAEAPGRLASADTVLLVPDLLTHQLTGVRGTELTNASTTGLLDVTTRDWSDELLALVGLRPDQLAPLHPPGHHLGRLRPSISAALGCDPVVTLVGSHDTASAVVGVPAKGRRFAYVCTGTWSLVGLELDAPVVTEAARVANLTNELGVDGRTRSLTNVMGFWVLQECARVWGGVDLGPLFDEAAALPAGGPVLDVGRPELAVPGSMPAVVARVLEATGHPVPSSRAGLVRCVVEGLATAYAAAVARVVQVSGQDVDVVHVVGGGARTPLLCQLTADRCGRPVHAGPVEATALGNILVQARSHGLVEGDLDDLRSLLRATQQVDVYLPR